MAVHEGEKIKVDPIRSTSDIKKIAKNLSGHPRDLALFVVGINTNFRASDLLKIKVGEVRYLKAGDHFVSNEQKTSKERFTTLSEQAYEVIQLLLATMQDINDEDPLFQSRKTGGKNGKGLSVATFSVMVKEWCTCIKGNGNYGSHTLRKTFGFMHRTELGTDLPTLMVMFNHSSQKQTLDYLGIQSSDIKDAYMKGIKYK